LVGIGSVSSAQKFAQDLGLLEKYSDRVTLLADETGAVSEALGCYRGWLAMDQQHKERYPQSDINPYLKLLGMIFGFGSPGTIGQVLYGYLGDGQGNNGPDGRKWVVDSLLQGSDKGRFPKLTKAAFANTPALSSLRPFELATLRLQTGLHIVSQWSKLGPKNGDLFTRMGGTFVFSQQQDDSVWSYFDQGILCYANVEEVGHVVHATLKGEVYVPPTKAEKAALKKAREEAFIRQQQEENRRLLEESAWSVVKAAEEAKSLPSSSDGKKGDVPLFFVKASNENGETQEEEEEEAAAIARYQEAEAAIIRQAEERARVVLDEKQSKRLETVSMAFASPVVQQQQQVMEPAEVTWQEWQDTVVPLMTTMEEKDEDASDDWLQDVQAEPTTELSVPADDIQASEEPSPDLPVPADAIPATEGPSTELLVPSSSTNTLQLDEAGKIAKELFYRTLLEARFKYDQSAKTAAKSAEAAKSKEAFQRKLLASKFTYARSRSVAAPPKAVEEATVALQADDEAQQNAVEPTNQLPEADASLKEEEEASLVADETSTIVPASDEAEPEMPSQSKATLRPTILESSKNEELFQRKLLEAKFKYSAPASQTETVVEAFPPSATVINWAETVTEEQSGDASLKQKEIFQRQLLEARFQWEKAKKVLLQSQEVSLSPVDDTVAATAVPVPSDDADASQLKRKELFQRQLLQARFQLEQDNRSEPEDEEEVANTDTYGMGFQKNKKKQGKKSKSKKS
jgi:hypothetical protein